MWRSSRDPGNEDHGVPPGAGGADAAEGAGHHEGQDLEAAEASERWSGNHRGKKGNFTQHSFDWCLLTGCWVITCVNMGLRLVLQCLIQLLTINTSNLN